MGEPKQIGAVIAEAFVGRRVRFPDLAQQFDRAEVHTVEKLLFGGYDTSDEEEDPGVEIQFITSHAPGLCGATKAVIICGLSDRVEFVEEAEPGEPAAEGREEPGPLEYRAQQPCECHLPVEERRFRQDAALEPLCVPCWARGCLERATREDSGR